MKKFLFCVSSFSRMVENEINRKRATNIAKREQAREEKEKMHVQQVKANRERHNLRLHTNVRSKTDVIRRLELLPSNRQLIRETIKYRRRAEKLEKEGRVDLKFLQKARFEMSNIRLKFSL